MNILTKAVVEETNKDETKALLEQVFRDNEILMNRILDTHKSTLESLVSELEGEKKKDLDLGISVENRMMVAGFNQALNLSQDKLRKLTLNP